MNGLILKHTEIVAEQLLDRSVDDPEGEIEAWVTLAQRREAMVVRLYASGTLEQRFSAEAARNEPMCRVARDAIAGICAQESSHTALMSALRAVDGVRARGVESLLGRVEGLMTQSATTEGVSGPIARWLIGAMRETGMAPEFTRYFTTLNLAESFRFSMELEDTACRGYRRVAELIDRLEVEGTVSTKYGTVQRYEFAKTAVEERFHFAVFERLLEWPEPDGTSFAPREAASAVSDLREVAQRTLALQFVPSLPEQMLTQSWVRGAGDGDGRAELISDGGFGAPFREYGIEIRVAAPPLGRSES